MARLSTYAEAIKRVVYDVRLDHYWASNGVWCQSFDTEEEAMALAREWEALTWKGILTVRRAQGFDIQKLYHVKR